MLGRVSYRLPARVSGIITDYEHCVCYLFSCGARCASNFPSTDTHAARGAVAIDVGVGQ